MPTDTFTRMELRWLVEEAIRELESLPADMFGDYGAIDETPAALLYLRRELKPIIDTLRQLEDYLR